MISLSHTSLFAFAVMSFVALLIGSALWLTRRARRITGESGIESFLSRLVTVDHSKLAFVANPSANPDLSALGAEVEEWQLWELVGGMEGLAALSQNCQVLIEMVCYIQQWYPEALPVAEQLRLHAREMQWHVDRLRGAEARGHLRTAFPDYAQRAVAIYCTVTERVLALAEDCQLPGSQQLRTAL